MVQDQIAEIERERDTAPTLCEAAERKRELLLQLKSIGPATSAVLSCEVYYRQFANRRPHPKIRHLGRPLPPITEILGSRTSKRPTRWFILMIALNAGVVRMLRRANLPRRCRGYRLTLLRAWVFGSEMASK
jgi:hypothetical protein